MPGSQENRWHGFRSEVEYIRAQDTWDGLTRAFQPVINSFREIGPVVNEAEDSIEAFNRLTQQDNTTEYPRWDSYHTYWYDAYGIYHRTEGLCFVCNQSTHRLDITLDKMFCNSLECNRQAAQLEKK